MEKFDPKKILVPVDFSGFSKDALDTAAEIAELRKAQITALHVMAEPKTSVPYEVYVDWEKVKDEMQNDAEKMLTNILEKSGLTKKAEKRLVWGNPPSLIVKMIKEQGFDLIVMATHGRTGLNRMFIGSVAEYVIRHASCPVLVMRPQE